MENYNVNDSIYKLQKLEVIGETISGKRIFSIIDCDKSFCDVCQSNGCTFEYFFKNNKEKALHFVNEVYDYETTKKPQLKDKYKEKIALVLRTLELCSGKDNQYDFLFRNFKLVSIKYDIPKNSLNADLE